MINCYTFNSQVENSTFCQSCATPKPLYNGIATIKNNKLYYRCNTGYSLSDSVYDGGRACNKAGEWVGKTEPYCKGKFITVQFLITLCKFPLRFSCVLRSSGAFQTRSRVREQFLLLGQSRILLLPWIHPRGQQNQTLFGKRHVGTGRTEMCWCE